MKNPYWRFAAWTGGAAVVCFALAGIEALTGIVGWLAPTEVWLFVWLAIGVVCTTIVRSYMRGAIALPNVRRMAAPRRQHRTYTRRTEGMQ